MGKSSRWQTDDIFSYFSLKIGSDTSCKLIASLEDSLYEESIPIF